MNVLLLIIIFTALGGVLSVLVASIFLLLPDNLRVKILPHGISFAIGALLAVAFWGLIPRALKEVTVDQFQPLSATILAGILAFFVLEKLLLWRHCHSGSCEVHSDDNLIDHVHHQFTGTLIIVGDSIHNFVDGVLIAAAFLTDIKLGVVTSLAVATHEIPQEVGDFIILLQGGYNKSKALFYNVLASFATVIGGVLAYYSLEDARTALPFFLALAASSFIYIAVADLIPSLHKKTDLKTALHQIALILAGILVIIFLQGVAL